MSKKTTVLLIILIACILRAPITGVGSLINVIAEDLSLTSTGAGMLTTIPVLSFAAVSAFAVWPARKYGAGNVLLWSTTILCFGIIIRSLFGDAGLFAGTILVGLAIGICNVLIPAVIKSHFPDRIPLMTSIYTAVMQIVSAISTAVSVPVAIACGWNMALLIWLLLAIAAMIACIRSRKLRITSTGRSGEEGTARIYRAPMTWWVTGYMGFQSLLFYSFIAWLSPIMQDRGYDQTDAGYILSLYVIMGILGSCALPFFMKRNKTQSATGIQLGILYTAGVGLMIWVDSFIVLMAAISLCGFCSGTCISFAMALFGLHTSNGEDASKLSGIAQSIGYLIAAAGPVLLGQVYGMSGGWEIPLVILLTDSVLLIFLGRIAGRDEIIS